MRLLLLLLCSCAAVPQSKHAASPCYQSPCGSTVDMNYACSCWDTSERGVRRCWITHAQCQTDRATNTNPRQVRVE